MVYDSRWGTKSGNDLFNPWLAYVFKFDEENGSVIIYDNNGRALTSTQVKSLIMCLNNYLLNYSDEEISRNNKRIDKDEKELIEKIGTPCKNKTIFNHTKKRNGYIYFVTTNNIEFKIGRAKDVKSRMGEYTHLPYEPQLIHLIESEDYIKTEELFHDYFKTKRLRGEWFKLSTDDVKYIKSSNYTKEISNSIHGGDK